MCFANHVILQINPNTPISVAFSERCNGFLLLHEANVAIRLDFGDSCDRRKGVSRDSSLDGNLYIAIPNFRLSARHIWTAAKPDILRCLRLREVALDSDSWVLKAFFS